MSLSPEQVLGHAARAGHDLEVELVKQLIGCFPQSRPGSESYLRDRLASHPAVFVNGIAYTIVGVYSSAQRVVSSGSEMLIPENAGGAKRVQATSQRCHKIDL